MIFLIVIIALAMGSFASCVSYRLGEKQDFIFTRSKCVKCNNILSPRNLIPVFSWLFQRGKCSKCHQKISWRYPIIEILFLFIYSFNYFICNFVIDEKFIILCLISTNLMIMSIVDIEKYFIPNILQFSLLFLVVLLLFFIGGFANILSNIDGLVCYFLFGLALYLFFYFTANIEAIGFDDLKLLPIAGLAIGLDNFLLFIFMVGVFGLIFGVFWQKIYKEKTFPFAPVLCLSLFICLNFSHKINLVDVFLRLVI